MCRWKLPTFVLVIHTLISMYIYFKSSFAWMFTLYALRAMRDLASISFAMNECLFAKRFLAFTYQTAIFFCLTYFILINENILIYYILYTRHYNHRLVYFLTSLFSAVYDQEGFQIKSGLWRHVYRAHLKNISVL